MWSNICVKYGAKKYWRSTHYFKFSPQPHKSHRVAAMVHWALISSTKSAKIATKPIKFWTLETIHFAEDFFGACCANVPSILLKLCERIGGVGWLPSFFSYYDLSAAVYAAEMNWVCGPLYPCLPLIYIPGKYTGEKRGVTRSSSSRILSSRIIQWVTHVNMGELTSSFVAIIISSGLLVACEEAPKCSGPNTGCFVMKLLANS